MYLGRAMRRPGYRELSRLVRCTAVVIIMSSAERGTIVNLWPRRFTIFCRVREETWASASRISKVDFERGGNKWIGSGQTIEHEDVVNDEIKLICTVCTVPYCYYMFVIVVVVEIWARSTSTHRHYHHPTSSS